MSSAMIATLVPRPVVITSSKPTNRADRIIPSHPAKAFLPSSKAPILRTCPRASSAEQATSSSEASSDISKAVALLQKASTDSSVPPRVLFQALRTLEQAKLPTEEWPGIIGGSPGGRRWRLVFTSGTKEVQKAMKSAGQEGTGKYFPLTAVQRWDATVGQIENGIFLGHVAALTFSGPYAMKGKKLSFDFDTLKLKLGPWTLPFNLKAKITDYSSPPPKDPFFLFFYVSEDLIAARGRGGGIAFWARTTPAWELENGIN
jgi:hypothetical protein